MGVLDYKVDHEVKKESGDIFNTALISPRLYVCRFIICVVLTISCSHFLDTTVLLWDNRRPFIPLASFSEHSDDVTGKVKAG